MIVLKSDTGEMRLRSPEEAGVAGLKSCGESACRHKDCLRVREYQSAIARITKAYTSKAKYKPQGLRLRAEDKVVKRAAERYLEAMGEKPVPKWSLRCGTRTGTVDVKPETKDCVKAAWPCLNEDTHFYGRKAGETGWTGHCESNHHVEQTDWYPLQIGRLGWVAGRKWTCGCITKPETKYVGGNYNEVSDETNTVPCARHANAINGRREAAYVESRSVA